MEREYEKPSMKVYELQGRMMMLCGSGTPDYDQDFTHIPGIGENGIHLA